MTQKHPKLRKKSFLCSRQKSSLAIDYSPTRCLSGPMTSYVEMYQEDSGKNIDQREQFWISPGQ
jgi:hypothetical protein